MTKFLTALMTASEKIMKIQSGGQGDQQAAEEERKAQVDDMKNSILSQVLSQEARARCEYKVSSKSNYFRSYIATYVFDYFKGFITQI